MEYFYKLSDDGKIALRLANPVQIDADYDIFSLKECMEMGFIAIANMPGIGIYPPMLILEDAAYE